MLKASVALMFGALMTLTAHAQVTEIFKCKGTDGHWTYTNDRREAERQKCEVVTRQVNVAPAQKAAPSRPARANEFPRETPGDRANAATRQRDILEKELVQEQASLAKARQDLAAQEAVRSGEERNYARVEERLQPFKDSVETHEKNIEALRRELNNLSR
jgi:septal ring factor EnvC (AmiA/AmiB activator)